MLHSVRKASDNGIISRARDYLSEASLASKVGIEERQVSFKYRGRHNRLCST